MNDQQYIDAFETHLLTERRVSRNTFSAYQSDLKQFRSYLSDNDLSIASVSATQLRAYVRSLHQRSCKARTIARKISALKVLYAFLEEHQNQKNTAEVLVMPKIEKSLPVYLTQEEVMHLLKVAEEDRSSKGQRNVVMLHLLYASGMRVSELVGLRIDQFHFDTGFVTIYGKGGRQRDVPLPMPVCHMVTQYIAAIRPKLLAGKDDGRTDTVLFPSGRKKGTPHITRQTFWMMLKELLKEAGISKKVSPHSLRHSLATHLLQAGADLRSLQLWLGHEQMSTVEIYTHLEKSKVRKTYDKKHPRA